MPGTVREAHKIVTKDQVLEGILQDLDTRGSYKILIQEPPRSIPQELSN